ncbi:MmcQ/YjbR family DNA-binding protein [Microbacterium sp. USHLN186]|uniref:MmcQ/YjbR family DNA-binding protein n=1 Tax=Microbacterium sp. USHLN186 TaxID=3081286 RepID=UPI00301A3CAE
MATIEDVRRIVLGFPRVVETVEGHRGGACWRTSAGMIAWERPPSKRDLEQLAHLGREWPAGVVLGIHVESEHDKSALIETYPHAFFTIPHFDGYPAVLTRLDQIDTQLLRETLTDAWLLRVPTTVARAWLAENGLVE